MNRDALDEFFARADDVLTDWRPSGDAMVARADDEGAELPLGDSYYAQSLFAGYRQMPRTVPTVRAGAELRQIILDEAQVLRASARMAGQMRASMEDLSRACAQTGASMRALLDALRTPRIVDDESVRRLALEVRKNRNTGPRSRVGLDGHFRRRIATPTS